MRLFGAAAMLMLSLLAAYVGALWGMASAPMQIAIIIIPPSPIPYSVTKQVCAREDEHWYHVLMTSIGKR